MRQNVIDMKIIGKPGEGLFGATLGFFIGFAAVALFGTTAAKVKDLIGLSPLAVGFLVAMPALSGSLLRIPFAAWVDTVGGRRPFLVLLGLSLAGMAGLTSLLFAFYPGQLSPAHTPLIFLLGLLSGCGIATFSVGTGQVSYWFPKSSQGKALGVFAGVGNLAPGIFSFLLPLVLGWNDRRLPDLVDFSDDRHAALLFAWPERTFFSTNGARRRPGDCDCFRENSRAGDVPIWKN